MEVSILILIIVFPLVVVGLIVFFAIKKTSKRKQTIAKEKEDKERSEMEKILIKNAKIDTLASINPNDTEDAQEKIKVVKELDNLK